MIEVCSRGGLCWDVVGSIHGDVTGRHAGSSILSRKDGEGKGARYSEEQVQWMGSGRSCSFALYASLQIEVSKYPSTH